jgi:hypothetical protein
MHCGFPNVIRLQVHLPGQQYVTWNEHGQQSIQEVVQQAAGHDSTLTAFFKANRDYPEVADNVLYQDFPSTFVYDQKAHKWKPRQRGFAIRRMYYAQPTAGECFYLRLLLTAVKGPTSYENLCTFQNIVIPSFREACLARGLLENDQEWLQCWEEAKSMAAGRQLRELFITILHDCAPSDPVNLWNTYWPHICDDLCYQRHHNNIRINPTDEDVQDYGLYLINKLLLVTGKSLCQNWLRNSRGTGNTVSIGSRVCLGTGTGLGLPYLGKTVPFTHGFTGMPVPDFRSGEWSYDFVDSQTLNNVMINEPQVRSG